MKPINFLSGLCLRFWVILFAVEKLPSLAEKSNELTTFLFALSILIIGIDIGVTTINYFLEIGRELKHED